MTGRFLQLCDLTQQPSSKESNTVHNPHIYSQTHWGMRARNLRLHEVLDLHRLSSSPFPEGSCRLPSSLAFSDAASQKNVSKRLKLAPRVRRSRFLRPHSLLGLLPCRSLSPQVRRSERRPTGALSAASWQQSSADLQASPGTFSSSDDPHGSSMKLPDSCSSELVYFGKKRGSEFLQKY